MAELVEAGGEHCQGKDEQDQPGPVERLVRRRRQPLLEQHPSGGEDECDADDRDENRSEQHREGCRDPPGDVRV